MTQRNLVGGNVIIPLTDHFGFGIPTDGSDAATGPRIIAVNGDPTGLPVPAGTLAIDYATPTLWQASDAVGGWAVKGGAGEVFVFQPGGTASGNVYTDFNAMWDVVSQGNPQGQTIVFDFTLSGGSSAPIPVRTGGGSYGSVEGQIWLGIGQRPILEFPDGTQFDQFPLILENLEFDSLAGRTTVAFTIDGAYATDYFLREARFNGDHIEFININTALPTSFHCWGVNTRLRNSGYEFLNSIGAGSVTIRLYDYSEVEDDAVRGAVGSNIRVWSYIGSGAESDDGRVQTNAAGTFTFTAIFPHGYKSGAILDNVGAPHALVKGPDIYRYDTSGGAFQVDLPIGGVDGDEVILKSTSNSANPLTINGNGFQVEVPSVPGTYGATGTSIAPGAYLRYVYDAAGSVWRLC